MEGWCSRFRVNDAPALEENEKSQNQPEGWPSQNQEKSCARSVDRTDMGHSSAAPLLGNEWMRVGNWFSVETIMRREDNTDGIWHRCGNQRAGAKSTALHSIGSRRKMTAAEQWKGFLSNYDKSIAALARTAVSKLRSKYRARLRWPTTTTMHW